MTQGIRHPLRCKRCRETLSCSRCGEVATPGTEFSQWFRSLAPETGLSSANFDNQNLDYIWFAYRSGWFILIEEKRQGGTPSWSQSDTHSIIDQMLRHASGAICKTRRGARPIEYRGYYVIRFTDNSPTDSWGIWVNDTLVDEEALRFFLKTGSLTAAVRNMQYREEEQQPLLVAA